MFSHEILAVFGNHSLKLLEFNEPCNMLHANMKALFEDAAKLPNTNPDFWNFLVFLYSMRNKLNPETPKMSTEIDCFQNVKKSYFYFGLYLKLLIIHFYTSKSYTICLLLSHCSWKKSYDRLMKCRYFLRRRIADINEKYGKKLAEFDQQKAMKMIEIKVVH